MSSTDASKKTELSGRVSELNKKVTELKTARATLLSNIESVADKFRSVVDKISTITPLLTTTDDSLLNGSMLDYNKLMTDSVNDTLEKLSHAAESAFDLIDKDIASYEESIAYTNRQIKLLELSSESEQ